MRIAPNSLSVVAFGLVTFSCAGTMRAVEVLSVSRQAGGTVEVTVPTGEGSYYILWRNADAALGAFETPEAVMSGTGNPLVLTSAVNAGAQGFYRVQEEPLASLLDLDGDTMPDAYELIYPFLDPLDPDDGALDFDGDGVSNAQEYADGTDPSLPTGGTVVLVINEVEYDQPGPDNDEYVEIFNPSASAVNLTGLALVLVNGNNNNEYLRVALDSAGSLAPGQYLVVGSGTALANVPPTAKAIAFVEATNNVQNGEPDGMAIIDVAQSSIIDALSYEGAMTAANINGFPAPVSLVEGTVLPGSVADSNTVEGSLSRIPDGQDTNDAATDWKFTATPTPGAANVP